MLTIGFARRNATYKRLGLLSHDPDRALALLVGPRPGPVRVGCKVHPSDEERSAPSSGSCSVQRNVPHVAERGGVSARETTCKLPARPSVRGCYLWLKSCRARSSGRLSGTSARSGHLRGCTERCSMPAGGGRTHGTNVQGAGRRGRTPTLRRRTRATYLPCTIFSSTCRARTFDDRDADGFERSVALVLHPRAIHTNAGSASARGMVDDYPSSGSMCAATTTALGADQRLDRSIRSDRIQRRSCYVRGSRERSRPRAQPSAS